MKEEKAKSKEMIQEAVKRMKILKLHRNVIKEFEEEQKLNKSDYNMGILYWLDEKEQKMIKVLEKRYSFMIYHVIHSYSNLGETYEMLFVEKDKEEWDYEKIDLKNGFAMVRVEVMEYSINSEFGYIGVKSLNGGIVRTC